MLTHKRGNSCCSSRLHYYIKEYLLTSLQPLFITWKSNRCFVNMNMDKKINTIIINTLKPAFLEQRFIVNVSNSTNLKTIDTLKLAIYKWILTLRNICHSHQPINDKVQNVKRLKIDCCTDRELYVLSRKESVKD